MTSEADAGSGGRVAAHFNWRSYGMLIALAVIVVLFTYLTDGTFISPRNIAQLMRQGAVLIVVAAGVALLIIQREIDLSIGSAVYLAGLAAATAQTQWGWGTVPAILRRARRRDRDGRLAGLLGQPLRDSLVRGDAVGPAGLPRHRLRVVGRGDLRADEPELRRAQRIVHPAGAFGGAGRRPLRRLRRGDAVPRGAASASASARRRRRCRGR